MAMTRILAVLITGAAIATTAQADSLVHLDEVGFDLNSKYVARGAIYANQAAVQPTATFSLPATPLSFDVWGSFAPGHRSTTSEADELDFTATAGLEVPVGSQRFDVSCGVTRYAFPGAAPGERSSHEVCGSCAHQSVMAPTLTYSYDFDLFDASYLEAACCPEFALNRSGSLSVCVSPSIAFGDLNQSFGFQDATVALSTWIDFGGLSLSPLIGYSYGSAAQNPDHRGIWSGIGLRFAAE